MILYKTGETCPLCGQILTTTDPDKLLHLSELAAALSPEGARQMTVREYAVSRGISIQAVYQQIHAGKLSVVMRGTAGKPRMYILPDAEPTAPPAEESKDAPGELYCSIFTCSRRRGNYCCASCFRRETCSGACQNSPDRCRAASGESRPKRRSL